MMENEGEDTSEQPMGSKKCRHNQSELEEKTLFTILEKLVVVSHKGDNETFKTRTY